ncbi:HAD-IIIA family hydrolase [Acidaminococcus fermentans]|uniref:HAD-IIIA family hydrolase n=1 Tax=Acidaminococcus fermentans TaxID=905 RepID=UPI002E76F3C7|nr:HAD-IIIA family hydrolase [Acidaminococcus fermentans]MEE1597466.1 HAD-IIIA family hydrolase [Acidaminococcus fermentans]MEE4121729.1 HAD-IIIA family hydrolase [Acidaminococcus fermentans]
MKTVIMAGGKGTRIAALAPDIPKPMIPIDGVPVLEREIESLVSQGFDDILITVSHLGKVIMDYFGDGSGVSPVTGKPFQAHITYYVEKEPLGNAGALFQVRDQLTDEFLLLNADAVFDVNFHRFIEAHHRMDGLVTLFVHSNSHPYDSGLLITDEKGAVEQWLTKEDTRPQWYFNTVNAGLHVMNKKVLEQPISTPKVDLDRQILKPLAGTGKMFVYNSPEYVEDMGTPERYAKVQNSFQKGIIHARNLVNKQKAVFLDRDGTINRYVGYLTDIDQFELLPGAAEAIRKINLSGYLAIVVTNQPVVARGDLTMEQLQEIHKKMETLLGKEGAYVDHIYVCPHHPDKGFPGEVPELKISCECRKPKPGMLLQAARDYNIDLTSSWMIGDDQRDIRAGINAGCHTALIGEKIIGQEQTVQSLLEFVDELPSLEVS